MLAQQRHSRILHEVQARGTVHVHDLAELLDVSAMTVRRDLAELDEQGLLNRVHGGAESAASTLEPDYAEKMSLHAEGKAAIARRAARLLHPGHSVAFSAGTTCTRIAQEVTGPHRVGDLTVVTNSLPVADEFFRSRNRHRHGGAAEPRVLLTGGERTPSDALVGPLADAALADLHVDLLFIGAHGAGESGLTTPNLNEARTNRALVRAARQVVAVFDHSKWGVTGLSGFARWSEVDTVITEPGLPPEALALLRESVAEVIVAS
ncbi:DeoR/GlpR family DNA-binding transcription regulator [Rothia sp. AR01]|uniref:DeoR/GlpR family DNA-binding transcription regulator n=1 Tax=Rothia santali TaxID=2949643 RepID=A0A9X2H9Y8_9MICC|nr:DeoR/GlpR family DNA-binding transcription regulator [Rothia santali]MCP3425391.1 DeoR/GlpR family DNA-binding transcription regulator [Rothia santali]